MSENNDKTNGSGSNLLLGVIVGAALTYLFATKSGQKIKKELLKDLSDVLESIGAEIEEKVPEAKAELSEVKEKIEEKKEEVEKKVEQVAEEVKAAIGVPRPEGREEIREVPQQIEKIQKKGRRFFFRKSRLES